MAKYHDLVERYAEEIERIKVSKAQYEKFSRQADEINPVLHPEPDLDAIARVFELADMAEQAYQDMLNERDKLAQDIEAEYWDVPFAKPRQQGIDGFWREAGLSGG